MSVVSLQSHFLSDLKRVKLIALSRDFQISGEVNHNLTDRIGRSNDATGSAILFHGFSILIRVFGVEDVKRVEFLPDCEALAAVSEDYHAKITQHLLEMILEVFRFILVEDSSHCLHSNLCVNLRPARVDFEFNLRRFDHSKSTEFSDLFSIVDVAIRNYFIEIIARPKLHRTQLSIHKHNDGDKSTLWSLNGVETIHFTKLLSLHLLAVAFEVKLLRVLRRVASENLNLRSDDLEVMPSRAQSGYRDRIECLLQTNPRRSRFHGFLW